MSKGLVGCILLINTVEEGNRTDIEGANLKGIDIACGELPTTKLFLPMGPGTDGLELEDGGPLQILGNWVHPCTAEHAETCFPDDMDHN
jgi:hypothetical protein